MPWPSPEARGPSPGPARRARLAAALLALAAARTAAAAPESGSAPILAIRGNTLAYEGRALRFMDPVSRWKEALGEPSRVREDGVTAIAIWDSLGLEASGYTTPDRGFYVGRARIRLVRPGATPEGEPPADLAGFRPAGAYPGRVVLEGRDIGGGPADFRSLEAALGPGRFQVRGARGPRDASLVLREPDGFRVTAHFPLHCHEAGVGRPGGEGDPCPPVFDELELVVGGARQWE